MSAQGILTVQQAFSLQVCATMCPCLLPGQAKSTSCRASPLLKLAPPHLCVAGAAKRALQYHATSVTFSGSRVGLALSKRLASAPRCTGSMKC